VQARGRSYGRKVDVWARGCMVLELVGGLELSRAIWDDGEEVSRFREELIRKAAARSSAALPPCWPFLIASWAGPDEQAEPEPGLFCQPVNTAGPLGLRE
jgi:hypothetical protein